MTILIVLNKNFVPKMFLKNKNTQYIDLIFKKLSIYCVFWVWRRGRDYKNNIKQFIKTQHVLLFIFIYHKM